MPLSRLMLHDDLASVLRRRQRTRQLVALDGRRRSAPERDHRSATCQTRPAAGPTPRPREESPSIPSSAASRSTCAPAGEVAVSYAYGFGGDLGGGPYDRRASLEQVLRRGVDWQMGVSRIPPAEPDAIVATLGEAVKAWNKQPSGTSGVIALMDSRTYQEEPDRGCQRIRIPEGSQLVIVAAGWPAEVVNGTPVLAHGPVLPRATCGRTCTARWRSSVLHPQAARAPGA